MKASIKDLLFLFFAGFFLISCGGKTVVPGDTPSAGNTQKEEKKWQYLLTESEGNFHYDHYYDERSITYLSEGIVRVLMLLEVTGEEDPSHPKSLVPQLQVVTLYEFDGAARKFRRVNWKMDWEVCRQGSLYLLFGSSPWLTVNAKSMEEVLLETVYKGRFTTAEP